MVFLSAYIKKNKSNLPWKPTLQYIIEILSKPIIILLLRLNYKPALPWLQSHKLFSWPPCVHWLKKQQHTQWFESHSCTPTNITRLIQLLLLSLSINAQVCCYLFWRFCLKSASLPYASARGLNTAAILLVFRIKYFDWLKWLLNVTGSLAHPTGRKGLQYM